MGFEIIQKSNLFRSDKYLEWIKTLPCVVSGQPATDCHHLKKPGLGGGMKCSDLFTIPLIRFYHTKFHTIGWKSWEEDHGDQWEHAARTLAMAVEAIQSGELEL